MTSDLILESIIKQVEDEPYAKKTGLKLIKIEAGYALVEMTLKDDLKNIFNMTHGGAIFSLIDEAFEISVNSHGTVAVALNMSVTFHRTPKKEGILRAESREIYKSKKTASYDIKVTDEDGDLIASCNALAYRKQDSLPF
jgi:acyl-CoA thioesterase